MAEVPNKRSIQALKEDEDMLDDSQLATDEFYLTADFDQNLTLLQKFRNIDSKKADLL